MEKFTMALFHERLYLKDAFCKKNAWQPQSAATWGVFW